MDIDNTFILTPEDLKDEKVIYKNMCIPASEKSFTNKSWDVYL